VGSNFCGYWPVFKVFADASKHAHYTLYMYNRTHFTGLIFADSRFSAKTVKIGPHDNFPLYGNVVGTYNMQGLQFHFLAGPLSQYFNVSSMH
jgi:hypothetical protein